MPSSAAHVVAVRTGGICLWPRWRRQTSLPQSSEGGQGHGCHSELKRGAQGCAGRTFPLQRVSLEGKGWRGPRAGAPGSGAGRKRRRRAEPEAVLEVTLPLPPGPRPCLRGPILQLHGLRWPPEAARLSQRPWPRTAPSPVQTRSLGTQLLWVPKETSLSSRNWPRGRRRGPLEQFTLTRPSRDLRVGRKPLSPNPRKCPARPLTH